MHTITNKFDLLFHFAQCSAIISDLFWLVLYYLLLWSLDKIVQCLVNFLLLFVQRSFGLSIAVAHLVRQSGFLLLIGNVIGFIFLLTFELSEVGGIVLCESLRL